MKVALFPFDAREDDRAGNLRRVTDACRVAAEGGARLLVLPELWASGYDLAAARKESDWAREIAAVQALSSVHHLAIVGSLLRPGADPSDPPTNCAFAFDRGEERSRYSKVHLFAPLREHEFLNSGETLPAPFDLDDARLAMAICYDLRFPELFRPASVAGVDLWCVCAQWPKARIEQWRALLIARAIESQSFLIGVNRCGAMGETVFGGNALVVDPRGKVLADSGDDPELIFAEFDPTDARRWREDFPALGDRRPDLYHF